MDLGTGVAEGSFGLPPLLSLFRSADLIYCIMRKRAGYGLLLIWNSRAALPLGHLSLSAVPCPAAGFIKLGDRLDLRDVAFGLLLKVIVVLDTELFLALKLAWSERLTADTFALDCSLAVGRSFERAA